MPLKAQNLPPILNKPFNPVYSGLFEFVIVTENNYISEVSYNLSYINTRELDKILVTFTPDVRHYKMVDFKDFLRDIKYVIHITYDPKGLVLSQFLIRVSFITMQINFSNNGSKILEVKVELENLGSEEISQLVDENYIKSIQRDFKLSSLI